MRSATSGRRRRFHFGPLRASGASGRTASASRSGRHALKYASASRRVRSHRTNQQKILGPMQRLESKCGASKMKKSRLRASSAWVRPAAFCRSGWREAGFKVVGFEAGPFWDTERDWVSDEAGSHKLYWNDLRITGGKDPLALGENNSGKGVGGGSVHWAAFTPRFHPSDFRVYTEDGVGVDWPISYRRSEALLRTAGARDAGRRPGLLSLGRSARLSVWAASDGRGRRRADQWLHQAGHPCLRRRTGGILSGSHGDRPHCIYRGFCIQGCKVGAKASTLITHVPEACNTEPRSATAFDGFSHRHGQRWPRRWSASTIDRDGRTHFQRAQGRDRLPVCHRNAAPAAEFGLSRA